MIQHIWSGTTEHHHTATAMAGAIYNYHQPGLSSNGPCLC